MIWNSLLAALIDKKCQRQIDFDTCYQENFSSLGFSSPSSAENSENFEFIPSFTVKVIFIKSLVKVKSKCRETSMKPTTQGLREE